ncbi:MAG: hypothetical protein J7599_05560 [Niabella sp.]|nr:hypothetical protein [Niabella sp.]
METGDSGSYLQIAIDEAINLLDDFVKRATTVSLKSGVFNIAFYPAAMEDGNGVRQPEKQERLRLIKQGRGHLLKGGTAEILQSVGAFGVREAQTPARNFKQNSGSLAGCRESIVLAVWSVKGMHNCN